jgi:hypothetical protein
MQDLVECLSVYFFDTKYTPSRYSARWVCRAINETYQESHRNSDVERVEADLNFPSPVVTLAMWLVRLFQCICLHTLKCNHHRLDVSFFIKMQFLDASNPGVAIRLT